jgi:hypothetical protein
MKNIAITLFSFVFAIALTAQQAPPQGINYQAMVYVPYANQQVGVNSAGQIPANAKQVLVKFTLEEGNNGPVIYEETHIDTTDQYGLLNSVIGTGTPTSSSPGLFNQIDWSIGNPYLRVSITLIQYNSTVTSYQKLWSVPYALYAGHSNYSDSSSYANQAGNGILGVTDNGNGTLTFNYLDGSSYTTPMLTGLMGAPGPQGQQGLQGPAGQNGTNGQSAYDIWLSQGNVGTQQDFLNSITGSQGSTGQNGLSAYEIWLAEGNIGTQQDFLNSLQVNSNNSLIDPSVQIPDSVLLLLNNSTYTVPQGKFVKLSCPMFNFDTPGYGAQVKINGINIYLSQGGYYSSWNTQENETEKYFVVQNEILLPQGTVIELLSEPRFLSVQEFYNNTNSTIKLVTTAQTVPLGKKWKIISSLISESIISVSSYQFKLNGISLLAGYGKNCNGCSPPDRFYRSYLNGPIWLPENTLLEPSTGLHGFVVIEY